MLVEEQAQRVRSVAKAAEYLAVSPKTIYRLIASGELGCIHVGRAVRITQEQLDAFITEQSNEY